MKAISHSRFFYFIILVTITLLFSARASSQVWTYRAGYGQNGAGAAEFGKAICSDASGNVYVTGEFAGTVDFGSGTGITSGGAFDGFVASYTSAGAFRWAIRFGGTFTDLGTGIATNGSDVYVTGSFSSGMTVGASATTYSSAGSTDAFVIKLNASTGATSWVTVFGGTGVESGQAITVDAQTSGANVYVSGTFSNGAGGATFGAAGVRTTQGGTATDLFVTQLNSSGTIVWASTGGAVSLSDNLIGSGICFVPGLAEIVVTGSFRGDATGTVSANYTTASPVSSVTLTNPNASANNTDFVLLELTASNGAFLSGSSAGSTNNEEGLAATYDASTQAVFFTGYFSSPTTTFPGNPAITNASGGLKNNIFYGRYNPSTNTYAWVREVENSLPASANDVGTAITSNGSGAVYVTGYFRNITSFPTASSSLTLTSANLDDPFLVKIDVTTGNALLAAQGSGDDALTSDRSNGVAFATGGNVWITGQYAGGLTFSPLSVLASTADLQDIFIAALVDPSTITSHPSDSTACSGLPVSFAVTASGTGLTYQWQEATNSGFTTGLVTLSNSGVYSGTASSTLSVSDNTGLNGRYYRAVVTNSGGSVNSNGALLTVTSPGLPSGNVTETHVVGTNNDLSYAASCAIISKVIPAGGTPVSGNVTSTVWVESSVPHYGGQPYVQRHYQITPAAGSTATVTLYFSQAEFDNFNNDAGSTLNLPANSGDAAGKTNLRISKFDGTSSGTGLPDSYSSGSSLIDPPDGNIVFNSTFNRWEVTFDVNGFSGFFVQTFQSVLPVTLISFSAQRINNEVQVKWQITSETGKENFEIERSEDGRTFTTIGQLAGLNGNIIKNYNWTDAHAALLNSLKIFYRLKIVSPEGSPKYSNTIVVSLNKNSALINSVTPNPFRDKLNINLNMPGNGRVTMRLKDITGRLLLSEYVQVPKGFSMHTINRMEKFNAGVYFLSIEFEGKLFTYKVSK